MACEMCANLCIAADKKKLPESSTWHSHRSLLSNKFLLSHKQAEIFLPFHRMQCWQGGKGGGGRGTGRSAPLSAWTAVAPFWSHRRNTVNAGTAKNMGLGNHSRVCCIRGLSCMLLPSHNTCCKRWNGDGTLHHSNRLKIKIQNSFRYRPHANRMWWSLI